MLHRVEQYKTAETLSFSLKHFKDLSGKPMA